MTSLRKDLVQYNHNVLHDMATGCTSYCYYNYDVYYYYYYCYYDHDYYFHVTDILIIYHMTRPARGSPPGAAGSLI